MICLRDYIEGIHSGLTGWPLRQQQVLIFYPAGRSGENFWPIVQDGLHAARGRGLLPGNSQALPRFVTMAQRSASYFHLHLVSDSTGETLTTVGRAATAQYTNVSPVEHVYPLVRTQKQLDR